MKLYKFRTVDKYSLIGLLQSKLWFSNLKDFNDPFEGRYMLDDEISPKILNKLIDKINIENAVPEERDKIFKELGIIDEGKDKKIFV